MHCYYFATFQTSEMDEVLTDVGKLNIDKAQVRSRCSAAKWNGVSGAELEN